MPNYLRLKLPKDFICDTNSFLNIGNTKYGYSVLEPNRIITEKGMILFKRINVIPKTVILFSNKLSNADMDRRIIHSDVYIDGNQWKHYGFGVNFELADTVTNFIWWGMDKYPKIYPDIDRHRGAEAYYNAPLPIGIVQYQQIGAVGIPDQATRLEEVAFTGPILVRTDIPHSTTYHTNGNRRIGVSIRFDETTFRSWETVRELFSLYAA